MSEIIDRFDIALTKEQMEDFAKKYNFPYCRFCHKKIDVEHDEQWVGLPQVLIAPSQISKEILIAILCKDCSDDFNRTWKLLRFGIKERP